MKKIIIFLIITFSFSLNLNDKCGLKTFYEKNYSLTTYHDNYFLIGYSTKKYYKYHSDTKDKDIYPKNYETEFQISIQKLLEYNLFGLNEYFSFGYTQNSFWQSFSPSAPFRETNYNPELFFTFLKNIPKYHLKGYRIGFRHSSNGQSGYRSRSWNRIFANMFFEWDNFSLIPEIWYRIPEKEKERDKPNSNGDDNPDIEKYLGYGHLNINYFFNKTKIAILLRNNLRLKENKGAIKLSIATPMNKFKNTYLYIKFFNGYGESLIDYNRALSKFAIGFAFFK